MKRDAIDHPKLFDLMNILSIPKYAAIGILESLWHFTARFTPNGNAGHYSDHQIALYVGWERDAALLMDALIESGWLDFDKTVHDWSQHADEHVHLKLARRGERFVDGNNPRVTKLAKRERKLLPTPNKTNDLPIRAHAVRMPCALPEPEPEPEPLKVFPLLQVDTSLENSSSSSSFSSRNGAANSAKTMTMMTTSRAFAKELRKSHPCGPGVSVAGSVTAAAAAIDEIGYSDELASRMRAAHEQWIEYWIASTPEYIPNLERWIESGDWERTPEARKKPVSRSTRLALELETERQQKGAGK